MYLEFNGNTKGQLPPPIVTAGGLNELPFDELEVHARNFHNFVPSELISAMDSNVKELCQLKNDTDVDDAQSRKKYIPCQAAAAANLSIAPAFWTPDVSSVGMLVDATEDTKTQLVLPSLAHLSQEMFFLILTVVYL